MIEFNFKLQLVIGYNKHNIVSSTVLLFSTFSAYALTFPFPFPFPFPFLFLLFIPLVETKFNFPQVLPQAQILF